MVSPKDKATSVCGADGFKAEKYEQANSSADTDQTQAAAPIKAQLQRMGWACFELSDGSFVVSRWGQCRPLPSLHAVHAFAKQIGGRPC